MRLLQQSIKDAKIIKIIIFFIENLTKYRYKINERKRIPFENGLDLRGLWLGVDFSSFHIDTRILNTLCCDKT